MLAGEGAEGDFHSHLQAGNEGSLRVREGEDRVPAAMGDEDALGGVGAAGAKATPGE